MRSSRPVRLPGPAAAVLSVGLATGAVAAVTLLNRFGTLPLRDVASSQRAVDEGRVWLLLTSAFVADRPAVPSVAGLFLVGLAALAFCGARLLWTAAALGHVGGTVAVYAALALAHAGNPSLAAHAVAQADYGTSAVIAAWIGLVALGLWRRGASTAAVGVCVVSGLVGWLFRPDLGVLDTEHLVALGLGIALAASIGSGAAASGAGAGAASSAGRASWRRRSRAAESPA